MGKKYVKIEVIGNLENAVKQLIEYPINNKGGLACCDFNGQILYSDTVSLDNAYKSITGMSYGEYNQMLKDQNKEYEKKEEEFNATLPTLIEHWKQKGRSILTEDKLEYWDRIVPIRARDLYHGMELDACLDIVKILNNGGSLDEAKSMIESQGHSGMSFSLVCVMVEEFCDRGKEFKKFVA